MDLITYILGEIAGYIWSMPLIILLVGTGVYYTFRLFFPQIRWLGHSLAIIAGRYDDPNDPGDATHFQALCAALSATVGVGNIAGVATAIHAGGPGALFWMWVSAFFGMMTKYSECLLALKYRVIHRDGTVSGGPMYYIEKGLGQRFKWMAIIFAFCGMIATFGGGNMVQSNSMAIAFVDSFRHKFKDHTLLDSLNNRKGINLVNGPEFQIMLKNGLSFDIELADATTIFDLLQAINRHPENMGQYLLAKISTDSNSIEIIDKSSGTSTFEIVEINNSNTLHELGFFRADGLINRTNDSKISTIVTEMLYLRSIIGFVVSGIVGIVIIGGMRRIARVADKLVPIMAIIYVGGGLIILSWNITAIPQAFYLIFKHAFTPTAAVGGFAGSTVLYTVTWGIKRAFFSNEAGMGSAPIAHATAKTREPVREGLVALMEPFIDTLIVCTITGLVIIVTGAWQTEADSSILTKNAFNMGLSGFGGIIVTVGLILFAISTAISWSYYGDRCAEYLFGSAAIFPYRFVFVVAVFIGSIMELKFVWNFADITNGIMTIPNLIGIIALSNIVIRYTRDYFSHKQERLR